jgi:hypothetical protein
MNTKVLSLLFFIIITGLYACKDKDVPSPTAATAQLDILNATGDTLNFFVNGTRQNNVASITPGGATGYLPITIGAQSYSFKREGSPVVLFNMPLVLDTAAYHSVFVGGASASSTFVTSDPLFNAEEQVSDTTCMLRFVNATPDAGTLTFTVSTIDTLKVTTVNINTPNCAFKYNGPYKSLQAGAKVINVLQQGGGTVKIDTTLTLQPGSVYTLFTTGSVTGKGTAAFAVSIITNE